MRAHGRAELLRIDGVVDHVQPVVGQREMALHVVLHHLRDADHGFERRAREHPRLGVQDVAVVGIGGNARPLATAARAQPLFEPHAVHAVAGAEDVAAFDPLVRLHDIGTVAGERGAHGGSEARVAPQAAEMERIADDRLDAARAVLRPLARIYADLHAARDERVHRALDEALRAAERRVALADDAEPHRRGGSAVSASSSATAAATRASGSVSRQSE